jgi:N-acetylglutamate synthase-like GNAT family acetyltransferase
VKEIIIKQYTKDYMEDVITLILDIQQKEFNVPITRADQPDLSDVANFYQTGNGNFWLALYDNQVVGTISLVDIGNRQGALRKMFVKAAFRGSNYNTAKLLLEQLFTWAKEHNFQEIYLGTTEKFLAAHRFYEKNMFTRIDRETLPSAFPIVKIDTRFYKRGVENHLKD